MQKIQAGHLAGSVILVGSVGSSVGPADCSPSFPLVLPSPEEKDEESVQLLVRPERSAGSVLMVTAGAFLLIRGGDREDFTRLLLSEGLVMAAADAVRFIGFTSWTATWSSAVEVDSVDGGLRPNSGLRIFSTEKGRILETDWEVGDDCRRRLSGCNMGGGASGGASWPAIPAAAAAAAAASAAYGP